jgi:hypothetical protein
MGQWEYLRLDLNDAPRRGTEIDVLNRAGGEGWELVGITSTNIAYLKRPIDEVKAKYRDPIPRRAGLGVAGWRIG